MADETRLKRFISDQEEAVQIARSTPEGGDQLRIDSLNVALSLAHCNAEEGVFVSVKELIAHAREIEQYLKLS